MNRMQLSCGFGFEGNRRLRPFRLLIGVRRGVSKGVKNGRRPPALKVGHPRNGITAVSGVACRQGVEGLGMAGPGEILQSPWRTPCHTPMRLLREVLGDGWSMKSLVRDVVPRDLKDLLYYHCKREGKGMGGRGEPPANGQGKLLPGQFI
jgi:hypothetical protein